MTPMELPELLKGGWQNALIMTYGLDALFFENAIMPVLGNSCRNRIILADGKRFLDACENAADSNLLRFLNQRYIAEGIHIRHAAHAKLILLTHPDRGRLITGSGNLNMQGYASGGELFACYDWSPEEPADLSAFQAVLEVIDRLSDAGLLNETVESHFNHMREQTPWLNNRAITAHIPVRHNFDRPFLQHFSEAIAGEPVEELWIMSPFYDRRAYALREMLARLQPKIVKLLVQPNQTSAVPEILQAVLNDSTAEAEVLAISDALEDKSPYFHAKLYLAKLANRAVCLQGSPNLSHVAMLRTALDGNIELANLLQGERDSFDHIFTALSLEPIALDDPELNLYYQSDEGETMESAPTFQLLGGAWQGHKMSLEIYGELPPLDQANLNIDETLYPLQIIERSEHLILLRLSEKAADALSRSNPLFLQWNLPDGITRSNPIFVYNLASLRHELAAPATTAQPDKFGALDIEDEELEILIEDLQAHMVLDQDSIWQLAGRRSPPAVSAEADDSPKIAYGEIDYDLLRRHPKIRQYTDRDFRSGTQARSRLQIVLSSITDHFQGLVDTAYGGSNKVVVSKVIAEADDIDADLEEDVAEEEEAREKRRQKFDSRLRNIFKHFIRRYLKGLRSAEFQQMAGYEVVSHNAIIFSHLLWRLSQKPFFADDPDFLIESMITTWQLYWGDKQHPGYFASLDEAEQQEVRSWLREYHGDAIILASLFWAEQVTRNKPDLRQQLRDCWHHLLLGKPFPIDKQVIEDTWLLVSETSRHQPPRPSRIIAALKRLAEFTQDREFLDLLAARYGSGTCMFDRVNIFFESVERELPVKCLVICATGALADKQEGISLLQHWMRFEELSHYRIAVPEAHGPERQVLYDCDPAEGFFYDRATKNEDVIQGIPVPDQPWTLALEDVVDEAKNVDQEMAFPLSEERLSAELSAMGANS